MENPEEVLQSLDEFAKLKPKDIPRELEEYLLYVAKTGDPVYQWSVVKCLFREKMLSVITDFYESCPSIDLPPCPNVDPFNYETMKASLLERLDSFANAPFTVQRLCELLTTPRKEYTRVDKFMRAIEKNILVVSTKEPGSSRRNNDNAQPEFLMNGVMEGRGLDIGEAIETVSSDGVNLMHETSATDPALADSIRVECEEMDMEEAAAADVAVAAAAAAAVAAAWDKPATECEIKTDASPAEVKHSPPLEESSSSTANASDFTPEVFGQPVELGTAVDNTSTSPVALSAASDPVEQPPQQQEPLQEQVETRTEPQLDQEQAIAVCSITEEPPQEEIGVTPVITDIQATVADLSEEQTTDITSQEPQVEASLQPQESEPQQTIQPSPSASETDKDTTKDIDARTLSVEIDAEPVSSNIADSGSGGCGDAPDHASTPLETNMNDEANVDIPSGMLKSESLLKSLEEFADNLTGLDGASTPPFSELNTDEDTQDAVRGSDQLDDDEGIEMKEEEVKPAACAENIESNEETRMEVDPQEEEEEEKVKEKEKEKEKEEKEEDEDKKKESVKEEVSVEKSVQESISEAAVDGEPQEKVAAAEEPGSAQPVSESPAESEPAEVPPVPEPEEKADAS